MKVSFISLGCAKNLVNTEQMMALCRDAGITLQDEQSGADVVVINTCGFIDSAKEEAIDTILAVANLKEEGLVGKILVTGCLSQRYQQQLTEELPEVDGVMGTGSYSRIVEALHALADGETPRYFDSINEPVEELERVREELHARLDEAAARLRECEDDMLRLSQLVTGRSQTVDGVSFEQRGIFIKTDHAAVLCQMGGDICGGGARRTGDDCDRGLGGIVAVLHTGSLGLLSVRQLLPHGLVHSYRAQDFFQ